MDTASEHDALLEQSTQHIKDFKLAIEFKYLMKHAPAGVYLMPEINNIRRLHGVIFLRRGLYRDGVFRFVVNLPSSYNDIDTHPEIIFTPPIFNPLIDPSTGKLDLRTDQYLKEWQPERHFIVTAITFLKRIFYMKSYDSFERVANEEAKRLFQEDKEEFWDRVSHAVEDSLRRVHARPSDPNCTLVFTPAQPAHEDVIRRVLFRPTGSTGPTGGSGGCGGGNGASGTPSSASAGGNGTSGGDTSALSVRLRDQDEHEAELQEDCMGPMGGALGRGISSMSPA